MASDSDAGAGRDWTEREARFVVDDDKFSSVMNRLGDLRLGPYSLKRPEVEEHEDTYFDTLDHDLYELGWSLRVRRGHIGTWITLKIPEHDDDGEDPDSRRKREIENTDYRDFNEVFRSILQLLRKQRVIHKDPDAVMDLAISNGFPYALGSVGLQDLFIVRTVRRTWPVMEGTQEVAELALDESVYRFKRVLRDNAERQCRMEAELRASAPDELLGDIIARLRGRFGLEEELTSKFEHGMTLYLARKLAEKVEVKIIIPRRSAHGEIIDEIKRDPRFVPGYLFTRDGEHRLKDIYFDGHQQELFTAGRYLRLRVDGGERDLKFRLLDFNENMGDPIQYEVSIKSGEDDFDDRWELVQEYLSEKIRLKKPKRTASSLDRIEKTLEVMGLKPTLEVDIKRAAWSVLKVGGQGTPKGARGELIARLKYDKIKFLPPGDKNGDDGVEFEVAGVEDRDGAPRILRQDYSTFLHAFTAQCSDHTGINIEDMGWQINAKYFEGLDKLGLHRGRPSWWGSLRTKKSMRRGAPFSRRGRAELDDDDAPDPAPGEGAARGAAARGHSTSQGTQAARDAFNAGHDVHIHLPGSG